MSAFREPFEYENFEVQRRDDVIDITMASTARMNGIHIECAEEFREIGRAITDDESIRCVTLTGTGNAYSVGADLAQFDGDESDQGRLRRLASTLHDTVGRLLRLNTPLVVAVNGVAAGAGFGLALLGDIVLMGADARLEFAYPRVGLTGDGASTYLLPRLVGLRKARELVLLDEPIEPETAVDLGLATEVVPADGLDERRHEIADRLADGPTHAYGETRRLLLRSLERSLEEQLAAETDTIATATRTTDYQRGFTAFFGDEPPEFEGR